MLKVYYWSVCPHCHRTMEFLRDHKIPFEALDIEKQPDDAVRKVVEANGGEDWVVPTLEYNGKWRAGKAFDERSLKKDLAAWGLM